MEEKNQILKRYYQGETTLQEEQELRNLYRQGKLPEDPMLAYANTKIQSPVRLSENIRESIQKRRKQRNRQIRLIVGSIAAILILIVSFRGLLQTHTPHELQLSDNIKKERFEDALRVIGNVLEEKTAPVQKVLYEDNNLIITVE